jgi:hypothetical protein
MTSGWKKTSINISPAGKAKAKDAEKKATKTETKAEVIVEKPQDAGDGQTAAEREEAENEEAGARLIPLSGEHAWLLTALSQLRV